APARLDSNSNIVTLDRQDRHLWKHGQTREADVLLQKALRRKQTGSYQMQAAISGVHCLTPTATATDWHEIVGLYRHLLKFDCSPVVQLNYAVALMMSGDHDTPGTILERLRDALQNYSPYFAAWGRLCELRGDMQAAGAALDQAAALSASEQERRFHLSRAASMLAS
ncbi:MAG: RNA polymerase subunit sigma-24, partial [Gammaproteobacteria bacterium]